jgi:hypothetical protein
LRKFGGLGPLVWEEIENEQTVHKGLAKLLYRLLPSNTTNDAAMLSNFKITLILKEMQKSNVMLVLDQQSSKKNVRMRSNIVKQFHEI